jgi:hypothetical protein
MDTQPALMSDRLWNARQVATEIFAGAVDAKWVRRNVQLGRWKVSHKLVLWKAGPLLEAKRAGTPVR